MFAGGKEASCLCVFLCDAKPASVQRSRQPLSMQEKE